MTKWTFEMYTTITEQTTVEANSYKEARDMLDSSKWEEVSSEGGELALVSQSLPKSTVNPVPFIDRLKTAYDEFTSEPPKVNPQGIPITYENKDELTSEDIESSRSDE